MAQNHNADYNEKPMTTYGRTQGPSRRYRRLRHPTFPAAEWTAKNPLLQRGEIGFESDTHKAKVGDGTTYWNTLPYSFVAETEWGSIVGNINDQTDLKNALDDKVDKNADITGATKCKITYDNKGLVTAGADLAESDIPSLHLSKISDVTASVSEVNVLDGITATTAELNYTDGVTSNIQTQLDSKQATISDLTTIRSNASAGKAASDTIATYGNIVTHNVSEFATSAQGALADSALQPGDNVSELVNNAGYLTQHQTLTDLGITATASEINVLDGITASTTELNYVDGVTSAIQTQIDGKQPKSTSAYNMGNTSGGWTAMSNTQQDALNSGANTTNIGQIATNTSNIADEIIDRQNADNGLQSQIDAIVSKSDVVDIVGTYAELQAYDTSSLGNNDVVKVISDSTHNNAPSYYRWVITGGVGAWVYIGSESETYTKAETDALLNAKQDNITATDGITLTSTTLTNSGVRAVASGTANGTISVNTNGTSADVSVTGLGSAAYTNSSAYATAAQGTKADTAVQPGDLATVATSGSYNDLINKPTIPAAQVNSDWNANSGVAQILNKPTLGTAAAANTTDFATAAQGALADTAVQPADLATVATTGDYDDLLNKPTIPTVNNPTITITQGGVTKGSFTLNQSSGDTIALDAGGGSIDAIDNLTITKNGDDEIQAVATVNANTAAGATNPVYDWVGTLAEYTTQDIENQHPDWICYITDDVSGGASVYTKTEVDNNFVGKGHEVIAFQTPNAGNNYTWYRKYADGWVEQGGRVQLNGAISATNKRVDFPVTMADSNYFSIASQDANTPYTSFVGWQATTGMSVGTNGASTTGTTRWMVCGMAA